MQKMSRPLEAERALTSSAAHEFRTPIAAAGPGPASRAWIGWEPQRRGARDFEIELKRVARLTKKLLQLARAEGAGSCERPGLISCDPGADAQIPSVNLADRPLRGNAGPRALEH